MDLGTCPADDQSRFLDGAHVAAYASNKRNGVGFFGQYGLENQPPSTADLMVITYQQGFNHDEIGRIPGWEHMKDERRIEVMWMFEEHLAASNATGIKVVGYSEDPDPIAAFAQVLHEELPLDLSMARKAYQVHNGHVRLVLGRGLNTGAWQAVSDAVVVPERYMKVMERQEKLARADTPQYSFRPNDPEISSIPVTFDTGRIQEMLDEMVLEHTWHPQELKETAVTLSHPVNQSLVVGMAAQDSTKGTHVGLAHLVKVSPEPIRRELSVLAAHTALVSGEPDEARALLAASFSPRLSAAGKARGQYVMESLKKDTDVLRQQALDAAASTQSALDRQFRRGGKTRNVQPYTHVEAVPTHTALAPLGPM